MTTSLSKENLNPWWVTGLSDAESSFIVNIFKNKEYICNWQVQPIYSIELHIKDLSLLYKIKQFFGVGRIKLRKNKSSAIYYVASLNDLIDIIIPHFIKYPLLTKKYADFLLFKMVVELMKTKNHLNEIGLQKIINIRASMNKGLTEILKSNFPNFIAIDRSIVNLESPFEPFWVLGFCDGESNFDIRINQSKTYKISYQVQLRFRITQHNRDQLLLTNFINFFNCGQIEQIKSRTAINYIVTNFKNITINIIPFFKKYSLLSSKSLDFSKIAILISSNAHLTTLGLKEIQSIKARMNSKRIYE